MAERLHGTDRQTALQELGQEMGNLRTAWDHWVARDDAARVMGMIEGMWALHESRGWYRGAIDLANEAIGVLDRAQPSPEHAADQLALRMSLARGMMALRGYGPETEEAFRRAIEMSEDVGTPAQKFPVLRALATYHMGIADFGGVADLGRRLLELGDEAGDESMLIEGHYVYGTGSAFSGDLDTGLRHIDRAIDLYDPKVHDSGRFRLGPTTGVVARTASGMILWAKGEMRLSMDRMTAALDVARQLGHPYSISYALHHNGLFALYRRRHDDALARARELAGVADENEYPVWRTLATVVEGVATTYLGDPTTGLQMTERGIELYQGLTAPPVFWSDLLRLRAWVHGVAGKPERSLELIDEALALVGGIEGMAGLDFASTKAELLLMSPKPDLVTAEETFLAVVDGAGKTGLRLLELRGLTGLVGVRREMGITPDGSDELAVLLETFPDELNEHDLVSARRALGT
jgi:hypothetical protein